MSLLIERLRRASPNLILGAWACALGFGIWLHTRAATQPPLGDAFSYYAKAYYIWTDWRGGQGFHPFDVWPFFRPPGTVLMSYPFGFNADPQWFFFRSVYFPAILMLLAAVIISHRPNAGTGERWRTTCHAIFFSALPMFFMFEENPQIPAPSTWGLVDGFLTGIAAFTTACAWRSVFQRTRENRWLWGLLTGMGAGLAIIIKPSGVFVAALAIAEWVAWSLFAMVGRAQRLRLVAELALGAVFVTLPSVLALLAATRSAYLSAGDIAGGQTNMAVMKIDLRLNASELIWLVHHNLGPAMLLWTFAALLAAGRGAIRGHGLAPASMALVTALFNMAFGVWFWIIGTGGATEMRYGMPFIMMGIVLLLPSMPPLPPLGQRVQAALTILWPANLLLLLLIPAPAAAWQNFSGVSITPPPPCGVQKIVEALTTLPRPRHSSQYLYAISIDLPYELASTILQNWYMLHHDQEALGIIQPVDWARPATYRIADLANASYILAENPSTAPAVSETIYNFPEETSAFTAWAGALTPAAGAEVIYAGPDARLLRVTDHGKLMKSLVILVSQHHWRPIFMQANAKLLREKEVAFLKKSSAKNF